MVVQKYILNIQKKIKLDKPLLITKKLRGKLKIIN